MSVKLDYKDTVKTKPFIGLLQRDAHSKRDGKFLEKSELTIQTLTQQLSN